MAPMYKVFDGSPCPYCKRTMDRTDPTGKLRPTKDHVLPRSKGGRGLRAKVVICCSICNGIKGDMMPDIWDAYMRDNPSWWLLTRQERRRRNRTNREAERTAKWGPRHARQGSPPPGPVVVPPALVYGPGNARQTPDRHILSRLYGRSKIPEPDAPESTSRYVDVPETTKAAPDWT